MGRKKSRKIKNFIASQVTTPLHQPSTHQYTDKSVRNGTYPASQGISHKIRCEPPPPADELSNDPKIKEEVPVMIKIEAPDEVIEVEGFADAIKVEESDIRIKPEPKEIMTEHSSRDYLHNLNKQSMNSRKRPVPSKVDFSSLIPSTLSNRIARVQKVKAHSKVPKQEQTSRATRFNSFQTTNTVWARILTPNPRDNPVILQYSNDTPISILCRIDLIYGIKLRWEITAQSVHYSNCKIYFGGTCVASSRKPLPEFAAEEAAKLVLDHMQEYCYTIVVSEDRNQIPVNRSELEYLLRGNNPTQPNFRYLIQGSGIWNHYQPSYRDQIKNQSLILTQDNCISAFDRECWKILNNHFNHSLCDLVFLAFRDEEISLIGSFASKLGLRYQRYWSKGEVIVVSHNRTTLQMLDLLNQVGGCSGKYTLIRPLSQTLTR
ncbi:hypothetical protein QAD02_010434 [Eretmocerus hayati]|uniref:Uncharacterized protein n=1 Tax=Eretmocerus hayati TaxID=131215 RepID=A0ACC2NTY2_9HYME|nr:hypothetical protein QAD02_010434 [Eretmocerus hayati]